MKKRDKHLLMAGAAAAGGYYLWKKKSDGAAVAGFPGVAGCYSVPAAPQRVGAQLPNSSIIPASLRGQCSPVWLDAALWGLTGVALGYYGLAKKKLPI